MRTTLVRLLAVGALATASAAVAAEYERAPRTRVDRPVSVVVTGAVTWLEPPGRIGIEGGWTVELPESVSWPHDLSALAEGADAPRVKVVGTRVPGTGERVIRAGGFEIVRDPHQARNTGARFGRRAEAGGDWRRPGAVRSVGRTVALDRSDDDTTLRGYIVEFTAGGFQMIASGSVFDVVVTAETEFEGFGDLSELSVGDEVEVRGVLEGSTIVASRVKLRSEGEEARLRGVVVGFTADGLEMDTGGSVIRVVVTADTELYNFGSLADLEIGDEVEARGSLVGLVLTATRLELLEDGVDFEYTGLLTALLPPDRFVMDDGRTYTVDPSTVFDPEIGGYEGLSPGQYLEVYSRRGPSGANLVAEIEYKGEDQGGQGYREIEGIVLTVSPIELVLEGGTVVAITPTTRFVGDADSVEQVVPGWEAEIYALLDVAGAFTALQVRTDDQQAATTGGQSFEPQQALVVPNPGASGDDIAGRFGAEVVGRVGGLGVLLWFPDAIDDDLLAALTADPDVAAVEPNYLFQDPESVRRRYPTVDRRPTTDKLVDQPAVHQLNLPGAQDLVNGAGVVVAVIDTGVDPLHPTLRRRLLPGGLDLVDGDMTPWEERDNIDGDGDGDVDDAAGHGTFVASLVGITAPGASILPYRVLDDEGAGTAYDLAVAIADAIERRVDVINLSLVYQERSTAVDLLLEQAAGLGIVVVASAGNDAAFGLPFPASDSNTVAVAALAEDGLGLAAFTNRSNLVSLAAPGETIFGGLDEQEFGTWSGTSMAAPFVSGAVALLLESDPGLDPVLIQNALEQSGAVVQDGDWTGTILDVLAAVTLVWSGP
jgi:hypothetical protein